MFIKTSVAAALAGLAASAPSLTPRDATGSFTLLSIHSGSSIQNLAINANGNRFWIGKNPSSYCPQNDPAIVCPAGTVTALTAYTSGGVSMDVEVPGGQTVYVDADGALAYTVAHSGVVPADAIPGSFVYYPATPGGGEVGTFLFNDGNFWACPEGGESTYGPGFEVYQIFAAVPSVSGINCISIAIGPEAFEGYGAWQY